MPLCPNEMCDFENKDALCRLAVVHLFVHKFLYEGQKQGEQINNVCVYRGMVKKPSRAYRLPDWENKKKKVVLHFMQKYESFK